jgi:hypothetical protein
MHCRTKLLLATGIFAIAACSAERGKLEIRQSGVNKAAEAPIPHKLAEAHAQLALGNIGLALELFRKVTREQPDNVDAQTGIAMCYDRMGRYDLSRRYYEAALVSAPASPRLLEHFAASLDMQGRRAESASVRTEIRLRSVRAPTAASLSSSAHIDNTQSLPQHTSVAAAAVTISLPAATPAPAAETIPQNVERKPISPAVSSQPPSRRDAAPMESGPRLVRTSPAEVALISLGSAGWRSLVVARSNHSTTVRFVPLKSNSDSTPKVRLLNAARSHGLAARTRNYLVARGWRQIAIGDAPEVRPTSVVLYPASRRKTAERLAAQFGMAVAKEPSGNDVVLILGRDSSRLKLLRRS